MSKYYYIPLYEEIIEEIKKLDGFDKYDLSTIKTSTAAAKLWLKIRGEQDGPTSQTRSS